MCGEGRVQAVPGWDKGGINVGCIKVFVKQSPAAAGRQILAGGGRSYTTLGVGGSQISCGSRGQLQVPARNLKLSTELCCLFPCQVKKLFVCFTCTSVFAPGLLLCSCSCVFLQFGPHSEKAELCTAPGPPEQCCKPLITCKSATCAVVSWEVGVSGFQCHPN